MIAQDLSGRMTGEQRDALRRMVRDDMTAREIMQAFQDRFDRGVSDSTVTAYRRQLGKLQPAGGNNTPIRGVRKPNEVQARIAAERFRRLGGFVILNATFNGDDLRGRALSHYLKTTLARGYAARLLAG